MLDMRLDFSDGVKRLVPTRYIIICFKYYCLIHPGISLILLGLGYGLLFTQTTCSLVRHTQYSTP
jgi:hypothetical protein